MRSKFYIAIIVLIILANISLLFIDNKNKAKLDLTSKSSNNFAHDHAVMMALDVQDDKSFLENMIPHHEEAVTASQKLLLTTENKDLIGFAKNVVEVQSKEIEQMNLWCQTICTDNRSVDYIPMMTYTAKNNLEADEQYIKGMIEHHKAAVAMAQKIKGISKNQEILNFAQSIITDQSKEIAYLASLQR